MRRRREVFAPVRPGHPRRHGVVARCCLRGRGPRVVLSRGHYRTCAARHRGREAGLRPLPGDPRVSGVRAGLRADVGRLGRDLRGGTGRAAPFGRRRRQNRRRRQKGKRRMTVVKSPKLPNPPGRWSGTRCRALWWTCRAVPDREARPLEPRGTALQVDPPAARRGGDGRARVLRHRGGARGGARTAAGRPAGDHRVGVDTTRARRTAGYGTPTSSRCWSRPWRRPSGDRASVSRQPTRPTRSPSNLLITITAELEKQRWMFDAENWPRNDRPAARSHPVSNWARTKGHLMTDALEMDALGRLPPRGEHDLAGTGRLAAGA
ncbi:hypothetical protein SALBM311S_01424 [Streptomyces alboniger]